MSYQPIENYGIIGNMRTVGLVGMNGGLPADSPGHHHICRRTRCVRGAVPISASCRPAFDYGRQTQDTRSAPHSIWTECWGARFEKRRSLKD
jgi:hypothetical protein